MLALADVQQRGELNLEITAAMVKELRQATGAGVLDCRNVLRWRL